MEKALTQFAVKILSGYSTGFDKIRWTIILSQTCTIYDSLLYEQDNPKSVKYPAAANIFHIFSLK